MTELPVNSLYYGFQWEGQNMGRFSFFIRLQGCPSSCFNCPHQTAAGAYGLACEIPGEEVTVDQMLQKEGQWQSTTYAVLTPEQLIAIVHDFQPGPFDVVIQGGEPAIHDLLGISHLLANNHYNVTLQTGGETPFEVSDETHISVRPRTRLVLPAALHAADEVIFIVKDPSDLAWLDILIEHIDYDETEIFIQPGTPGALQFCADEASNRDFRLSYAPDAIR